jgi:dinuclear metal center YbgI/SA1388 family protein
MTVSDIHKLFAAWCPKEVAWEKDNIGLQIGNMGTKITGILVCLDCTESVVREAQKRKANLIISHHPLLFRPPKSITPRDETGRTIRSLIAANIHLYSAHTNLDFSKGGTSFTIAEALGLENVDFLHKTYRIQKKIVTFVPEKYAEKVRTAMANSGAGIIGNYEHCSFATIGAGSFKGNKNARPTVGTKEVLTQVPEVKLEMVVDQWNVDAVIRALRTAHPYEEIAYDLYPLENVSNEFGMGIIGTLPKSLRLGSFVNLVKKALGADALRRTASIGKNIRRVAACGGAGGELLDVAIQQGADAFITADVRYHEFHHAAGRIVLIDAGHYETEHLVVPAVVRKLRHEFLMMGDDTPISTTRVSTNPIHYS